MGAARRADDERRLRPERRIRHVLERHRRHAALLRVRRCSNAPDPRPGFVDPGRARVRARLDRRRGRARYATRWDGAAWHPWPTPVSGSLSSVLVVSPDEMYAAGPHGAL